MMRHPPSPLCPYPSLPLPPSSPSVYLLVFLPNSPFTPIYAIYPRTPPSTSPSPSPTPVASATLQPTHLANRYLPTAPSSPSNILLPLPFYLPWSPSLPIPLLPLYQPTCSSSSCPPPPPPPAVPIIYARAPTRLQTPPQALCASMMPSWPLQWGWPRSFPVASSPTWPATATGPRSRPLSCPMTPA